MQSAARACKACLPPMPCCLEAVSMLCCFLTQWHTASKCYEAISYGIAAFPRRDNTQRLKMLALAVRSSIHPLCVPKQAIKMMKKRRICSSSCNSQAPGLTRGAQALLCLCNGTTLQTVISIFPLAKWTFMSQVDSLHMTAAFVYCRCISSTVLGQIPQ